MTNQPFLYNPQANVLRQRAEMEEPVSPTFLNAKPGDWYQYESRLADYNKHIASLPAFTPVSGWVPDVGKEYRLNVNFRIAKIDPIGMENKRNGVDRAIPIEQKQEISTIDDLARLYIKELRGKQQLQPGYPLSFTDHRKFLISFFNEAKVLNKLFTIEDMMKAYDAGCGDVNGTEKEKYFKGLNINLP